eukprot:595034-Rhodomonas_salina.2
MPVTHSVFCDCIPVRTLPQSCNPRAPARTTSYVSAGDLGSQAQAYRTSGTGAGVRLTTNPPSSRVTW